MDHMSIADDNQYDSHIDQTAEMQQYAIQIHPSLLHHSHITDCSC